MNFATKLRNLRIQRGVTQKQLAASLETSQSCITGWETSRREPDFKSIKRIADFFDVPMSALLPSEDIAQDSPVNGIAEAVARNPKLFQLFDKTRFMSDKDLDSILMFASALIRTEEPS